jgi:hypothetical protein
MVIQNIREGKKAFFFEKKSQKTFSRSGMYEPAVLCGGKGKYIQKVHFLSSLPSPP